MPYPCNTVATEVNVAVRALNRLMKFGRPNTVRSADHVGASDLGGRRIARGVAVVIHLVRLLIAALYADEHLNIEFKVRPAWHKLFELYLSMAEVAA